MISFIGPCEDGMVCETDEFGDPERFIMTWKDFNKYIIQIEEDKLKVENIKRKIKR